MKKILLLVFSCLFTSCSQPQVTKVSPEVSRIAYAVKDSFDSARIDLADSYSDQLASLVTPPKNAIAISPVIKDGKRVAVIPSKYRDDNVIVVGTQEWNNLLQIKDIVTQLANDKTTLNAQLMKVREEIREQQELKEKLAADNIILNQQVSEYKHALFKRTLYLISLLGLIGLYAYIKIKKIAIPFLPI